MSTDGGISWWYLPPTIGTFHDQISTINTNSPFYGEGILMVQQLVVAVEIRFIHLITKHLTHQICLERILDLDILSSLTNYWNMMAGTLMMLEWR